MTLGKLRTAATLALDPMEAPGIERQRLEGVEEGALQEMGDLKRVQVQITFLEQVEESRQEDQYLGQEREVLKDQGPHQENQELEEVGSRVEEVESKVEAAESKEEEEEEEEKLPALERNCRLMFQRFFVLTNFDSKPNDDLICITCIKMFRLASTSARVSMRVSLARVLPGAQNVAPSDPRKD